MDFLAPRPQPIRFWRTGAIAVVMAALGGARADEAAAKSMVQQSSPFGVAQTVQRIEAAARLHGLGIFLRLREPASASDDDGLVLVLESPHGGTPVVLRSEQAFEHSEVPLRLEVRPDGRGASRVLIPAPLAGGPDDEPIDLPAGLADDLSGLPAVVSLALSRT